MNKLLVINTPGLWNRGGMAIICSTYRYLIHEIPNVEIDIVSHHYTKDYSTLRYISNNKGGKILKHPWFEFYDSKIETIIYNTLSLIKYLITFYVGKKEKYYHDYDLVIDLNVDGYNSDHQGIFSPLFNLINDFFVISAKKPLYICAAAVPLFSNKIIKYIARKIFNKAQLITVRDKNSLRNLQLLGVIKTRIIVTADMAFLLEPNNNIWKINKYFGESAGYYAGITTTSEIKDLFLRKQYIKIMADLIDWIIEYFKINVLLIPHAFGPKYRDDYDSIYRTIRNKSKVQYLYDEYLYADELKGIITGCRFFIGSMLHSLIAATSASVPSICIALYSKQKFHSIFGEIMGQEKYLLEVNKDNINDVQNILQDKILDLIINRNEIIENLNQHASNAERQAALNITLIKDLLVDS